MNMKSNTAKALAAAAMLAAAATGAGAQEMSCTVRIDSTDTHEDIIRKAACVIPDARQAAAMDNEFIAFIHIGPNTFTRMEWGTGKEDPSVFALKTLDTDQWCRAIRAAGMKMVILTVKHHDGFVLWQSRYTKHGIMSTDFRDGKGDILADLSESCRKYGLKLGVYLSPADLYQIESPDGLYGNLSKATERTVPAPCEGRPFKDGRTFRVTADDYNAYFMNQLFEILTEYGPVHEVWFDGAHPKRKGGQQYSYADWERIIRELAPEAVIFGRGDIRWCGNEAGRTRESEWNVIPYMEEPAPGARFGDLTDEDLASREKLYGAAYLHYQPAETNTSIRDGWFFRDNSRQRVRSAEEVFDIYERSVGGNSIFLLNIPPDRNGRLARKDVSVLRKTGRMIRSTYGKDLLEGACGPEELLDGDPRTYIMAAPGDSIEIRLPSPERINRITICEAVTLKGERTEGHTAYALKDGKWEKIASATNIGHKRILRFADVTTDRIMIRIDSARADAAISSVSAHRFKGRASVGGSGKVRKTTELPQQAFTYDGQVMTADLGARKAFRGFSLTPEPGDGYARRSGSVYTSDDGTVWKQQGTFCFGNLRNDPSERYFFCGRKTRTRYVRIAFSDCRTPESSQIGVF